jgi:uncharacterized Zn finger protein (UPF0148 family)
MTSRKPAGAECGVVARWAEPHGTAHHTSCTGCGEPLVPHTIECPQCAQQVGRITAMLAQVIETAGGDRKLVISARTLEGGWEPVRTAAATDEAVRMIRSSAHRANTRADARAAVRHGLIAATGQGVLA